MSDLETLTARLQRARRGLDREAGEARAVLDQGRRLTTEIATLATQVSLHEQAAALLGRIADTRQTTAQTRIEALVTQGLRNIFDTDLSFHLVPGNRAKTPVVDFVVRSTIGATPVDTDILDARGGGLAAIVGFLLRLVILLLRTGAGHAVLFLDETFAHLSADYEPRLADLLRELVDRTGVQVIMVTHSDAYTEHADKRYRFELRGGITQVTEL